MTFASKSAAAIDQLILELSQHFKLRDFKIDRDRSKRSITISQHQYCLDILERFGMADCKPISTPMQPNQRLSRAQCPQTPAEVEFMKSVPYLAAVGALMYLATSTRPDIAYTVGCLARFNSNPGVAHIQITLGDDSQCTVLLCNYLITDLGDNSQCTRGKAVQLQIKYLSR